MEQAGSWTVLLVGGASGTGKSELAGRVAARHRAALVEVDDLVVAAQALTSPATHPALHYWLSHPAPEAMAPGQVVRAQVRFAEALAPAIEAVAANHLDAGVRVVIEGDYILPATAARLVLAAGPEQVRALFVHEPDAGQILRNYARREPGRGMQRQRARASALYGQWLAGQAANRGLPVLPARPWDSGPERAGGLLAEPAPGPRPDPRC